MNKEKRKEGGSVHFQSDSIAGAALFVYAGITVIRLAVFHVWYWEDLAAQIVLWMLFFYWMSRHGTHRFEEDALVLRGGKALRGEERRIPYGKIISVRPAKGNLPGAVRLCGRMDRRPMYALTAEEAHGQEVYLLKEGELFWDRLSARCPGRVHTEASDYLERRRKRLAHKEAEKRR